VTVPQFWHKLHTVDWQYKLSTYCTSNPQVYRSSQCVTTYRGTPTPLKTLGHGVFSCSSFFEIIQLLVEETIRYYHQYFDAVNEGQSPLPDMTVQELCLFWAITLQMGHDQRDTLSDYWFWHWNGTSRPFTETLWNKTDCIIYLEFYSLVTLKMNLTRQMKIMTDCGKWEL
jgi:hypothetical protein